MRETLTLKWGTLKGYDLEEGSPAHKALIKYFDDPTSISCAMQSDTENQKDILIEVINHLEDGNILLDFSDEWVTKERAIQYLKEY